MLDPNLQLIVLHTLNLITASAALLGHLPVAALLVISAFLTEFVTVAGIRVAEHLHVRIAWIAADSMSS